MKIAIVDDYLNKYGGAVQVVAALHQAFPEAPVYTSFSNVGKGKDKLLDSKFKDAKIIESWFAKLPGHEILISPLRFLLPLVWGRFNLAEYDLVISSASWAVTKGFARGETREICYCHTPPRYLYGYETSRNWRKYWFIRVYATVVNHLMRQYDFRQAQKVTWFVANSQEVQKRIRKFYRRQARVIYPPVPIDRKVKLMKNKDDYYITGGRLERAKNFDLVVQACRRLDLPLKVYGKGGQGDSLKKIAGLKTEFLGYISDEKRQRLLARAKAFIVAAADEDFGITPVEAMAAGCPVIAYRGGGYLESVVDPAMAKKTKGQGPTGVFFDDPTVENLVKTLEKCQTVLGKIDPEDCHRQAMKFSQERFIKEIKQFVDHKMGQE